jgi:hypothetical protein
MSFFSQLFVKKSDGTVINPAQEDGNLATINTKLVTETLTDRTTNIDGKVGILTVSALFARVSDTVMKHLRSDRSTESLMTIDYAHHEIHDGTMFSYDDVITLGSGATQDYVITVPDTTTWPHLAFDIESCDGGMTFELYEGTDKVGTTLQTTYNRNRNSATTATTTIHKGQSGGTTDGTRIGWRSSGTGAAGGKVSGQVGEATERVMKRNTKYIVRITSKAASNVVSVRFMFYEHTDRN